MRPVHPPGGRPGFSRARLDLLKLLERKVDYTFKDKVLLNRALSHRSYTNDNGQGSTGSYERLEFLGDAVLGMIVSEELYRADPEMMEGDLTKIKSSLVSRSSLARCSDSIHLDRYLLLSGGGDLMEGKSKDTILADGFEALIGAIYLDGGLHFARLLINSLLMPFKDTITKDRILHSAKSNLLQLSQKRYRTQPVYKVVKTTGPEHDKVFVCEVRVGGKWIARGRGKSKKEAEKLAAFHALNKLAPGREMHNTDVGAENGLQKDGQLKARSVK